MIQDAVATFSLALQGRKIELSFLFYGDETVWPLQYVLNTAVRSLPLETFVYFLE
jgi:hypothetical protein